MFNMVKGVAAKVKEKVGIKTVAFTGTAMAALASASPTFASPPANTVDYSGVQVGFTPANLLTSATGFYTLFIGFVILVLGIKLAPSLIGFLFTIIGKLKGSRG